MAEVKTKLTIVDNASKRLANIERALNNLNKKFVEGAAKSNKLDNAVEKINKTSKATSKGLNQTLKALENMTKKMKKASSGSSLLTSKLKRLASVYLGVMGTSALINTSDTLTSAENKFSTIGMNNGMGLDQSKQFSQSTMDKIYSAAKDSNSGYLDMASNVAKAITLAGKSFGDETDEQINNAIRFQNIMAKTYALGGASAAEQASSMYQLVQSLGAGKLQGDELRSLTEGAPVAAKAIEKFAQEVYGTESALKDMGSQGMLTSDLVVAAILNMGGTADSQFSKMDKTFAQLWTNFKSDATKAFEPFLRKMREIANSDDFAFLMEKATDAMWTFADAATKALGYVEQAISWIRNNWQTFEAILKIGVGLLIAKIGVELGVAFVKFGTQAVTNILKVVKWFNTLSATSQLLVRSLGLVGVIALICYVGFSMMADASQSLITQLGILFGMVALIIGALMLFGIIAFSIQLLIIAGILLLLGVFLAFTDKVVGTVYWLGSLLLNIIIGVINSIIQILWRMIAPFMSIIEFIYNAFNGGFNGIGGLFANLVGQIIGGFLDLAKIVTPIIDAIFGTDWTDKLNNLSDEVRSWGKTEDALTLNMNAPQLDRIDMTDAYDLGATHGTQLKSSMDDIFGKGVDLGGVFDTDTLTNKLTADYKYDSNGTDYLANIDQNTGAMANSMELSEEDLKYLRLLAEQEAINKFTTAEIKIDMTNNNNVSKGTDLDGVVTYLTDRLREELVIMADGVHR